MAKDIFQEAESLKCRSISIAAIEFKPVSRKRVAEIYLQALEEKEYGYLNLVRFIGKQNQLGAVFRNLDKILKQMMLKETKSKSQTRKKEWKRY